MISHPNDVPSLLKSVNIDFPKLNLPHATICLKPSPIHGKGVFATKRIPARRVVTFYPIHAIKFQEMTKFISKDKEFLKNFEKYANEYSFEDTCKYYGNYIIVGNPNETQNLNELGHMINDVNGNLFANLSYKQACQNFPTIYKKYQKNRANTYFEVHPKYPIVYIVSKKEILPDTELTIDYGDSYWFLGQYKVEVEDYEKLVKKIK